MRIATWNLHEAVGVDGRCLPVRIARVLAELDADVVALQEFSPRRSTVDELSAQLEHATGATLVVMPTFLKRGRVFGNALLCRVPIVSVEARELALERREPRNAIDARVDWDGRPLRVLATHLGLRRAERIEQIGRLDALLDEDTPTLLLGDFNEWRLHGCLATLERRLARVPTPPTFPSPCPVARLDRLFVSPGLRVSHVRTHRSRSAMVASDHLPLVATLERA
ncbi:MAG: endonuclease/exonuclease/phosphatase family protein [Dokdonella sp.]|uniref:endonuclease/exonuclease/phosphatase family protein n=1 Tax=Dokdonella sp. TaxID=2291710 RepID=UPI003F81B795